VDEGSPIAYSVLEKGVPVFCSDGTRLGTVHHVVAVPEEDIFHGLVVATGDGRRFVAADAVSSLHEHRVDLTLDGAAAARLPKPGGGAPEYTEDPATVNAWSHWVKRLTLRKDWQRRR
jgi:hypothetical protein